MTHQIREVDSAVVTHLLLGFSGVALDRLASHHGLQSLLYGADLLRLDVQLQGEERLECSGLLGALLVHHRSTHTHKYHVSEHNTTLHDSCFMFAGVMRWRRGVSALL